LLTGELRNKIDRIWDAFWAGGIANPLEVIEQITYLLFIRGLDDVQIREENKAVRLKQPIERRIFPEGKDEIGKDGGLPYEEMRWSRFRNKAPAEMFDAEMDRAVLRAYGWHDLADLAAPQFLTPETEDNHTYQGRLFWPSDFRDEVLARLLKLNAELHEEEVRLGVTKTGSAPPPAEEAEEELFNATE
jgi:hypothetical protein